VPAATLLRRFTRVHVIALGGPVEVPGARVLRARTADEAVQLWNEALG
jgi:hypothetical protein